MSHVSQFGFVVALAFALAFTQMLTKFVLDGFDSSELLALKNWFLGEDGKFCWSLPALFTILFKVVSPDIDLGFAIGFLAFNVTLNSVIWHGLGLRSVLANRKVSLAFIHS